ncbi:MAG TPA: hypothetical protein VHZ97_00175 [Pseudonocardiaceae bacterium]|nr:hypothetical protein [Pseudonocardiaceae bacterium]
MEPSQRIRDIADRHGLTRTSHTPLLARTLAGIEDVLVDVPAGRGCARSTVRTATLAEAMAAGFEMPKSVAEMFTIPAMLDDPGVTGFVLEVDGTAATTGQNIVDGDILGLYSGSGRPEYRRHGYFRALVSARLRDAVANGATFAFTQNTPMSRPLVKPDN